MLITVPLFLRVSPAASLQTLHSELKEDKELGVGVKILGRKVSLAALAEVDGEEGELMVNCMRGMT